jgi:hypothetical protein
LQRVGRGERGQQRLEQLEQLRVAERGGLVAEARQERLEERCAEEDTLGLQLLVAQPAGAPGLGLDWGLGWG